MFTLIPSPILNILCILIYLTFQQPHFTLLQTGSRTASFKPRQSHSGVSALHNNIYLKGFQQESKDVTSVRIFCQLKSNYDVKTILEVNCDGNKGDKAQTRLREVLTKTK